MRPLLLLVSLAGCGGSYGCGSFTFDAASGSWEAGEWCGLNGTFGFEESQQMQVIIEPGAKDDATTTAAIDHLVTIELRTPIAAFADGAELSMGEDLEALCYRSWTGAGSGDMIFWLASSATLSVGPESSKTLVGEYSHELAWDVDCGSDMAASGDDLVEFSLN